MGPLKRLLNLNLIANTLLISLCCYTFFIVASSRSVLRSNSSFHSPLHGTSFPVGLVDWSNANKTVVLALQAGCHYCVDSAPFYRRLVKLTTGRQIQFIAVAPQPPSITDNFLNRLGLSPIPSRQAKLPAIGVSGTPTIFIIDKGGTILYGRA